MNVLRAQKRSDLIALVRAGFSFREIERRLEVRRETVSKYARLAGLKVAPGEADSGKSGPGPPAPAAQKPNFQPGSSDCEPHREWIETQVGLGRNATAIYQDLVEQFGFSHAYNSVKRFVRRLKKKDPEQYDRLEFLPDEEAQVDYGQGALTRHPKSASCENLVFL
jgi:transposase